MKENYNKTDVYRESIQMGLKGLKTVGKNISSESELNKEKIEFLKNEIELYKETELQTLISYINIVVRGSARNLANVLTSSYEIALQNNSLKIEKKYIDAALSTLAL